MSLRAGGSEEGPLEYNLTMAFGRSEMHLCGKQELPALAKVLNVICPGVRTLFVAGCWEGWEEGLFKGLDGSSWTDSSHSTYTCVHTEGGRRRPSTAPLAGPPPVPAWKRGPRRGSFTRTPAGGVCPHRSVLPSCVKQPLTTLTTASVKASLSFLIKN